MSEKFQLIPAKSPTNNDISSDVILGRTDIISCVESEGTCLSNELNSSQCPLKALQKGHSMATPLHNQVACFCLYPLSEMAISHVQVALCVMS